MRRVYFIRECFRLLNSFDLNKTPGRNDGIPIGFYKPFWAVLKDSFIKCVNGCFEKGEMSNSQKQAVITLIEKRERSFASRKLAPYLSCKYRYKNYDMKSGPKLNFTGHFMRKPHSTLKGLNR